MNDLHNKIRAAYDEICAAGQLKLANSEYEPIDACPAKGAFAVLARRVSARNQIALVFGDAFHGAMEAHLLGKPVDEQINIALTRARNNNMGQFEDAKRNYGSLETLIRIYNAEYEMRITKFKPFMLDETTPAVEKTFELPLGHVYAYHGNGETIKIDVIIRGKLDLLSYWKDGKPWVVDHKTTSIMGEQFTADKMRGSQFILYVMGARTLVPHNPVGGCVINAACIRAKNMEFKTFDLPFPQWQLDQFKMNFLLRVQGWLRDIYLGLESGDMLTNRQSCVTKYGKCAYFDVCQAHPSMQDGILFDNMLFKPETHIEETYGS
jgi:hypothetical protein